MSTVHRRGLIAVLALGAGAAPLALSAGSAAADTTTGSSPSTLTVVGDGSVQVTPDLASLDIDVTRSATTSAAALSAANRRTDQIVAALKRVGVAASGIQSTGVSTQNTSHMVGPKNHRHRVRQYTADESVSVTMATSLAGAVIDAATRNGASSVDDLNFSFSDPDAGVTAANAAAIASARKQADAAASAVGDVVTGVQSVDLDPGESVSSSGSAVAPVAAGSVSQKSATPTNVHPGRQQVTASVQVVYTIAPATS